MGKYSLVFSTVIKINWIDTNSKDEICWCECVDDFVVPVLKLPHLGFGTESKRVFLILCSNWNHFETEFWQTVSNSLRNVTYFPDSATPPIIIVWSPTDNDPW